MYKDDPFREFFQTATVVDVYPDSRTCDIMKKNGAMLYNVLIANTMGGFLANDVTWPSNLRGAVVFYTWIDAKPVVMGTLPAPVAPPQQISTPISNTGTGSDNTSTYGRKKAAGYANGRDAGFMDGDKVLATDGGALLALLKEGGIILKASDLAQIIMGAGMDFIKIAAREFRIMTDFGELCFAHGSGGRTGLSITGGATYAEEAMPTTEAASLSDPVMSAWDTLSGDNINFDSGTGGGGGTKKTVHLYLGDAPDAEGSRFAIRVCNTGGDHFGALRMGADGKLFLATSENSFFSTGKDSTAVVDGNTYQDFKSNRTLGIGQDDKQTVGGKRNVVVGSDETYMVNGNCKVRVGEKYTHESQSCEMQVGEAANLKVGGNLSIKSGEGMKVSTDNLQIGASVCTIACNCLNITRG